MRSVYPIGTTIYEPDKCFNGYTLLWYNKYYRLIGMAARVAQEWLSREFRI